MNGVTSTGGAGAAILGMAMLAAGAAQAGTLTMPDYFIDKIE